MISTPSSNPDGFHYEVQDSFPFMQSERPLLAANCSEYAVAHANVRLQPARQMSEVSFLHHILCTMRRLRLTHLLRLQSYAWPYLGQGTGHGAVIVSAPRSGRTLSYVPPLCQAVCSLLTERRGHGQRLQLNGPIALVLAADLHQVQRIGSLCNAMLRKAKNEEWLTLVLTIPSAHNPQFFQRVLNGIGCLVATPAQFLWLCGHDIKMPDLRFVAYDDVDLMPPEQLQQAHQQLLTLAKQQSPQLVITTQSYNRKLLQMVRQLNAQSMVLFGDILEAALYGGARMRISLLRREAKHEQLLSLLEQRPTHRLRTVIYCHTDADIRELVQKLERHGHRCLPYYQTADFEVREQVHRWMQDARGELLIYTDDCPELDVRHAHTLVHYGMSDSWSKFKLRHLALSDNLRNRLAQTQPEDNGNLAKQENLLSFVFLDESNNRQLPRLVDFLKIHQHVDERIVQLSREIRIQLECEKCDEPALCNLLLSLGHCTGTHCEQRHQLLPHDCLLPARLPTNGDVKLQLLKVYTPAHYCVRLLEHLAPGGSWVPLPRQATLEMQLQLLQSQQCVRHWPPKAKEICVYRNASGFERVRILRVDPITQINLSSTNVAVEVQALDVDTRTFKTTSGKLYICPEQLRDAPPLALDLRILGLVPFTGESSWHDEDGRQCAEWLNAVPQPSFLQANVVKSLSHTIFVHELAVTSFADSLKIHVRRLNMCQKLAHQKLAKKCEFATEKLIKFLGADSTQADKEELSLKQHQMAIKPLTGKTNFFAKLAKQIGKANKERLNQEQQQPQNQAKVDRELVKEDETIEHSEDSVKALYDCLLNCTLLEASEAAKTQQTSDVNGNEPDLLNRIMEPLPQQSQLKVVQQKTQKTPKTAIPANMHEIKYQIPANVRRPEVIYYQTRSTLELQVILQEDHMEYATVLHSGCCIAFWTLGKPTEYIYQFIVNTHCPYQSLKHNMKGRTVYISVLKALAVTYPLDFSFYKFMKPQHDKFNILEEERRLRIANYETYLLHKGYAGAEKHRGPSSDDSSSDELVDNMVYDPCGEQLERAKDFKNQNYD